MCTMTWMRSGADYQVFFNRDERKTRLEAYPPLPQATRRGVRYLAPGDPHAGGAWLAVNEHRVTIGLLNHEGADAAPSPPGTHVSRGLLVLDLMETRDLDEVESRLREVEVEDYRPFLLVALEPRAPAIAFVWDGEEAMAYEMADEEVPLTTSSFDAANVVAARREMFEKLRRRHGGVTEEMLGAFHASRDPRGGPYSVSMRRDEAETVSVSHIKVGGAEIEYHYRPRASAGTRVRLHLA